MAHQHLKVFTCLMLSTMVRVRSALYQAALVLLCVLKLSTQLSDSNSDAAAQEDANALGFTRGTILFGSERLAGLKSNVTDGATKPSNASAGDDVVYQADYAAWSEDYDDEDSDSEVEWRRMAPSLQCGGDRMKFRAMGPRASQFQIDQGNAPPLPLSQVPQSCGYSMQKNFLGLVMVVPYDGCNMVLKSEGHLLPLLWQGTPVSLLCPQSAPAEAVKPARKPPSKKPAAAWGQAYYFPHPYHDEPTTTTKKPPAPEFAQYPFYYPPFMHYPFYPATTKAPTTTKPPAKQQPLPFYPHPFFFAPYLPPKSPTTTAKTTAATKAQHPVYPSFVPVYPPFFPYPVAPPTTTTAKPKTTTKALPPHIQLPFPPFFPYPIAPPTTTTTTAPPTTTKAQPPVAPHFHPHGHLPFPPFFRYPVAPPTTTTSTTTKAQPPVAPHFHPHGHLPFPPFFRYPVAPPTTTTSTTTKAQPPVAPHFHPHIHLPVLPLRPFPPYRRW